MDAGAVPALLPVVLVGGALIDGLDASVDVGVEEEREREPRADSLVADSVAALTSFRQLPQH